MLKLLSNKESSTTGGCGNIHKTPVYFSKFYQPLLDYSNHKAALPNMTMFLKSILAGIWVALYGHACTYISGHFYVPSSPKAMGLCKLLYALLFNGAFVSIVYTETELFTGNTAAMSFYVLHYLKGGEFWRRLLDCCRVLVLSFFGNLLGAVGGAYMLSYLPHTLSNEPIYAFLTVLGNGKVSKKFGETLLLGIGCNMFVCLATLACVTTTDSAGKILAICFTITVFAAGGFEHIVANLYTLSVALMYGIENLTVFKSIAYNFLPTLIGNFIAGTVFSGIAWYYTSVNLTQKITDDNDVYTGTKPLLHP